MAKSTTRKSKGKDEFFIGWQDAIPTTYRIYSLLSIGLITLLTFISAWLWVADSEDFVNSKFEYGNQTTFKGVIYEYPAPMIVTVIEEDTLAIPLVNFGKSGVKKPMDFFKSQMRNNLLNYQVELKGTVIEFDGRIWLELTDEEKALKSFHKLDSTKTERDREVLGEVQAQGEIVDPKCFFGVMKPGFGKVHLSCAVRCISGGIPPILVAPEVDGKREYFFITGPEGDPINQRILPYVGIPISVTGTLKVVEDWKVIEIGSEEQLETAVLAGPSVFSVCNTRNSGLLAEEEN